MKIRNFLVATLGMAAVLSCAPSPKESLPLITWIEGVPQGNQAVHTIMITNASALGQDWAIYCSQMPTGVKTLEGSDADIIEYQANLHRITPVQSEIIKDTLIVRYSAQKLRRRSWAPEGFVLKTMKTHSRLKTEYEYLPLEADGDRWFAYNEGHKIPSEVEKSAIIPTPKNRACEDRPQGWYKVIVTESGEEKIEAEDEDGRFYAGTTLNLLRENYAPDRIPATEIEDWPDFQYRGFMLDVSRNFTTKDCLLRLIDQLSRYKVNYLHLHFGDDEGWRIEIDGIPELTSVGGFHSFDPDKQLQPSYDGCADPEDMESCANGYYSREDFKEILRYAWARRIRVIAEFDTPGHSRAAIYAMKAYEKRTGDASMRLQDPEDDSKYYTAQGYTDNVMNVEMESVYTFVEKIFDSLIALYDEAGVPLPAIHIGGDEVPSGAWHGNNLHDMFLGRIADIATQKGVKICGWQEIAAAEDPSIAQKLRTVMFANNAWNTTGENDDLPCRIAAQGYPTVMSNVQFTYADQAYSDNKNETAHNWACYTDDFKAFRFPVKIQENILGVQAQLWSETVRSFDDVCYDIFPKVMGVFERAWNAEPLQTSDEFYGVIVAHEMPHWESDGIAYHVPQPGLKIVDGQPVANTLVPGASVEITESGNGFEAYAKIGSRSSVATTAR